MSLEPRLKVLLIVVFLTFWAERPICAQTAAPTPAGAKVVLKVGANLKVGEQVVDTGLSHRVYAVERAQGDWRWLVSGKIAGWARAGDLIPLDDADEFYTAEITKNPHAPWPYVKRGLAYHHQGNIDKAFSDYSAAIQQDPHYAPALINRGNIWLARKTPDRAIQDFSDAIEADPKSILAHVNRAIAYQTKEDYDKALADYDEAVKLGWNTAAAYNNRGYARYMKKDYHGALADFDEAIKLEPGYALALMNRGRAQQARGEYQQALADFTEATRLNPKAADGFADRAWLLATCPDPNFRNGKEAVKLANQANDLADKKSHHCYDVSAAAHAEAGDFATAVAHEGRAIELVPTRKADAETRQIAEQYRARLKLYQAKQPYHEMQ
jgi:tetratricopeptide (TPR) repeat protein